MGICKLRFESAIDAEKCIELMNDRWYDERQLKCYYWDGKTDYKAIKESTETQAARLSQFGQWLESEKASVDLI